ncbi:hypothetical protein ACC692_37750, partial [Rhizobium ruizarguesonis]
SYLVFQDGRCADIVLPLSSLALFVGRETAAVSLRANVEWGRQPEEFAGAGVWLLPNPSGLNRAFTLTNLTEHYLELRLTL